MDNEKEKENELKGRLNASMTKSSLQDEGI